MFKIDLLCLLTCGFSSCACFINYRKLLSGYLLTKLFLGSEIVLNLIVNVLIFKLHFELLNISNHMLINNFNYMYILNFWVFFNLTVQLHSNL